MTFTEMCGACDNHCPKTSGGAVSAIGAALERCLVRAISSHRVSVGIQDCAKLLGCAPDRVLLCIMPDMADICDVSMHIQHTLVRSFCWEHDIRMLSVQNSDKLQNLVNCAASSATTTTNSNNTTTTTQQQQQQQQQENEQENGSGVVSNSTPLSTVSCLLIEAPEGELSADETFVCSFHDTVICSDVYPKPVVELPI